MVFRDVDWRRWFSTLAENVVRIAMYVFIEHSVIAIVIIGLFAITTVWKLLRFRRQQVVALESDETPPVPPELLAWMERLDKLWEKQGSPRPSTMTPLEHLMALPTDSVSTEVQRACRELIEFFYRARFRGEVISAEELKTLGSSMEEVLHAESR